MLEYEREKERMERSTEDLEHDLRLQDAHIKALQSELDVARRDLRAAGSHVLQLEQRLLAAAAAPRTEHEMVAKVEEAEARVAAMKAA